MLPASSQDLQGTSFAVPEFAWAALLLPMPGTQHVQLCLIVTSACQHGMPIGCCQHVAKSQRFASQLGGSGDLNFGLPPSESHCMWRQSSCPVLTMACLDRLSHRLPPSQLQCGSYSLHARHA